VLKNKYPLIQNFEFNDFIFSEKTHIKIDNEILNIINDYNKIKNFADFDFSHKYFIKFLYEKNHINFVKY
jgi:hypothetical protein